MKAKKILLIITALCCTMTISACNKKQNDTGNAGNVSRETTASKAAEKSDDTTVIDVFSELNVTFEGTNDNGKIVYEYTGDNEFVKEYVKFKCPTDYGDFRNGETAIIKLDFNEFKAEQQNITFKELEHEYTVEGLWGEIISPDGYDFSEIDEWAYSFFSENEQSKYVIRYLNKFKNSNNQNETLNDDNLLLITKPDGNIDEIGTRDAAYWEILSLSCEPCVKVLSIFENKDFGQENTYSLYYKISIKAEKSAFEVNNASKDTIYNVGDIKEWDFIGALQFADVSVEKDSNIVYQLSDPFNSFILDTSSECYDNDFDTFFDNFFTFPNGCHYLYDFTSNDPKWEKK